MNTGFPYGQEYIEFLGGGTCINVLCVFCLMKLVELTVTCRSSFLSDIILFQSGNTKKLLLC